MTPNTLLWSLCNVDWSTTLLFPWQITIYIISEGLMFYNDIYLAGILSLLRYLWYLQHTSEISTQLAHIKVRKKVKFSRSSGIAIPHSDVKSLQFIAVLGQCACTGRAKRVYLHVYIYIYQCIFLGCWHFSGQGLLHTSSKPSHTL